MPWSRAARTCSSYGIPRTCSHTSATRLNQAALAWRQFRALARESKARGSHLREHRVQLDDRTLNRRTDMSFKEEMAARTTAAIRRCMDAGLAPRGDAETVSLGLRTAVHGAVSLRVSQPELPWPPLEEQVDRFLTKLVGVPPAKG
jgi:AcrR family transcriptional regulator